MATVNFENNHNLLIVAVSPSAGLIPSVVPGIAPAPHPQTSP
jgi:xanthine/uracil permease